MNLPRQNEFVFSKDNLPKWKGIFEFENAFILFADKLM